MNIVKIGDIKVMPKKRIDLIGQVFDKLTVIGFSHSQNYRSVWECKCECGEVVLRESSILKANRPHSCGCSVSRKKGNLYGRYGEDEVERRIFGAYTTIRDQVRLNKDIGMDFEWYCDYESFRNWAKNSGFKEFEQTMVVRIDKSEGYFPHNCKVLDKNANSVHRIIKIGDMECSVKDWAKILDVSPTTITTRLKRGF